MVFEIKKQLVPAFLAISVLIHAGWAFGDKPDPKSSLDKVNLILRTTNDFNFTHQTLGDVAKHFCQSLKTQVEIDKAALDEIGCTTDSPVNFKLKGVTNKTALKYLLAEFGLTYILEDEYVLITSLENSEVHLQTRVYPVADLVTTGESKKIADYAALKEVMMSGVAPNSWEDVGGEGSLLAFKGSFVVRQTATGHATFTAVLDALRKAASVTGESFRVGYHSVDTCFFCFVLC